MSIAKYSTDEFKTLLGHIQPNLVVLSSFQSSKKKILIMDELNIEYLANSKDLLKGSPPTIQSAINKEKCFISKAKQIHGDRFDYSKVRYINNYTKVKIICSEHGEFLQQPSIHLRGSICFKCSRKEDGLKKATSAENFINKMGIINPNIKILGNYINGESRILISDENGIEYFVEPRQLIRGSNPSIQTAVDKNKCFSIKSNIIHNNKYKYDKVNYVNILIPVTITCPYHGDFIQLPKHHLATNGCPLCKENVGFNRSQWINFCKNTINSDPKLYIIKCFNKFEIFIKIGITSKSIYERFKTKTLLPYSYETLKEIKGSPDFVFDKEHKLHKYLGKYKYYPKIHFDGETECFTLDCLKDLDIII